MVVVYGLKNCDTCRKAIKALPDAQLVDVRKDGVPADVLARYEGSRASFGSSTVVRFYGSDCSGCPYSMPAVEADRVRSLTAGTLVDCSECGRLVVR